MSREEYKSSLKEKIPYSMYAFGQGIVYTLVSQFLMFYYTDYVFLPELVVSAIMFGGKIWDGVNDTLFGLLMDKIRFKSGKRFIPYLRLSAAIIPVSTVLLFSVENIEHMGLRITAAILTYVFWDLCYTISDAPMLALPTVMTTSVKDRSTLMTFLGIGGAAAMALSAIVIPMLFKSRGFFVTGLAVGAVSFVTMMMVSVFCKERFYSQIENTRSATLKETWKYLKTNHYLLMFYCYRLVSGIISASMLVYMAKWCLGDEGATGTIAVYSMPMIIVIYLMSPFILKKFDKITVYRVCTVLSAVMYLVTYLIGYQNKTFVLIAMAVIAALAILPGIVMGAIPQDCIEYGTFKSGIRKEGITFALQSFISKVIAAFASVNAMLILHFTDYDPSLTAQSDTTTSAIWAGTLLLPMAGMLLGLVFLFAYKLKDRDVQLMSDANKGKITKEEALSQMSREYK